MSEESRQLLIVLGLSSLVSIALYAVRAAVSHSSRYWFLNWNLALAWPTLIIAWWLSRRLQTGSWLSWPNLLLTALWLGFLPNSFYLVSDFIHLHESGEVSLLYDIVLFFSFTWNGFVLGFSSLYLVHKQLLRRLPSREAHLFIGGVLLLCGYAVYLGRYLRWNTWDVLVNPAGLLFDVSDRFINPASHPQMFTTTAMFFVLLASIYAFSWRIIQITSMPAAAISPVRAATTKRKKKSSPSQSKRVNKRKP
jgi:uncharacterized membrane protein